MLSPFLHLPSQIVTSVYLAQEIPLCFYNYCSLRQSTIHPLYAFSNLNLPVHRMIPLLAVPSPSQHMIPAFTIVSAPLLQSFFLRDARGNFKQTRSSDD
jgi:hypothetical protein